jgi:hypothetical protein
VDQVALGRENFRGRVAEVPSNLAHPYAGGVRGNACDLYPAVRQFEEKQHDEPLQAAARPDFDGDEVSGHDQVPVPRQKLLPGRLPAPVGDQNLIYLTESTDCVRVCRRGPALLDDTAAGILGLD